MGLFNKQFKPKCRVCGMETLSGGVCAYCGQSDKTKKPAKAVTFTRPSLDRLRQTARHQTPSKVSTPGKTKSASLTGSEASYNSQFVSMKKQTQDSSSQARESVRQVMVEKQAAKPEYNMQQKRQKGQPVRVFFFLVSLMFWLTSLVLLLESFDRPSGRIQDLGNEGTIVVAVCVFFMAVFSSTGIIRSLLSILALSFTSFFLLIKPLAAPVKYYDDGVYTAFSLSSETHMYFWVSGFLLVVFTLSFFLSFLKKIYRRYMGN